MAEREARVRIDATIYDYTEFLQGYIWSDLKREIEAWIEDLRDGLEMCEIDRESDTIRGRLQALRNVLELPSLIKEGLESDIAKRSENGRS